MSNGIEKHEEHAQSKKEIEAQREKLERELIELDRWWQAYGGGWKANVLRIAGVSWPIVVFVVWAFLAASYAGNVPVVLGSALAFIAIGVIGFKMIDKKLVAILKETLGDDHES